jgi:5-methyltetrahydrofolate--homocysteine methyltransferase
MIRMIDIVKEMRSAAPGAPILVHANAGLPQTINRQTVYPESPDDMAALVPDLIKAGANIIGGCCGTTPEHIRKIKEKILNMR